MNDFFLNLKKIKELYKYIELFLKDDDLIFFSRCLARFFSIQSQLIWEDAQEFAFELLKILLKPNKFRLQIYMHIPSVFQAIAHEF